MVGVGRGWDRDRIPAVMMRVGIDRRQSVFDTIWLELIQRALGQSSTEDLYGIRKSSSLRRPAITVCGLESVFCLISQKTMTIIWSLESACLCAASESLRITVTA